MPIGNAMKLLNEMDHDPGLRRRIYKCQTQTELSDYLASIDRAFTRYEFEEAVNHLHVQCQTHEQAEHLMARAQWYAMVVKSLP
ncbi:MAG: hypothetical protein QM786_07355 [Breznakibacter sp.]